MYLNEPDSDPCARLLAIYLAICEETARPRRADLSLEALIPFIGDLTVIELTQNGRHYVRLMGERTVCQSHRDLTGSLIEDRYDSIHLELLLAPFQRAARKLAAVHEIRHAKDDGLRLMDRLVLPLFHGQTLTGFIVGLWADAAAYPRRPSLGGYGDEDQADRGSRLFQADDMAFTVTMTDWPLPAAD